MLLAEIGAITSWLLRCQTTKHWAAPPASLGRRRTPQGKRERTRAVAKTTIRRLLSRRDI
ncbi:hypothetical protein [Nonomuraea sp. NPDC049725]|uniref:hypothetical protein n=1 Tax=Nonomuraea sp. NPDC049725 TaxID=3154508 RepID=UPI00342208F2